MGIKDDMKENHSAIKNDGKRRCVFLVSFLVVFFGVSVTLQIATIKLAGGFFYFKEICALLKNDQIGGPASVNYCTEALSSVMLHDGSGLSTVWLSTESAFLLFFVLSVLMAEKYVWLMIRSIYKSDIIRIRPPILQTFRSDGNWCNKYKTRLFADDYKNISKLGNLI
jgi:hypothetical protein